MAALKVTTLQASDARGGDVVLAPDGNVYQCDGDGQWSQMEPVLTESGPLWKPAGKLTLLVRGGKPQAAVIAPPAPRGLPWARRAPCHRWPADGTR